MGRFEEVVKFVDWEKCGTNVPVVLQAATGRVMDLRLVNRELFNTYRNCTADEKAVWWCHLEMSEVLIDCDADSLLCKVPERMVADDDGWVPTCYFPFMLEDLERVIAWKTIGDLVPVVTQAIDGSVLMQAWMNRDALRKTIETKHMWYWSRTRQCLWEKGATSGNFQVLQGNVEEVFAHCEHESLLFQVRQKGSGACHEGYRSCFFRRVGSDDLEVVGDLLPDTPLIS